MPKLRRYCWRTGGAWEMDENEVCSECGSLGSMHKPVPVQTECGCYAGVTDSNGGPCILPIGHEGPHVPHPDTVRYYKNRGKKIIIGDWDD